jgi:hypothetical protein
MWTELVAKYCKIISCNTDRTGGEVLEDHLLQCGQNWWRSIARSSLAMWTELVVKYCKIISCNMDRTGGEALQDHLKQICFGSMMRTQKNLDAEVLVSNLHTLLFTTSNSRINSKNVKNK